MTTPHLSLLTEPETLPSETPTRVLHELEALREAVHALRESARRFESAHGHAAHPRLALVFELLAKLRAVGADDVVRAAREDGFTIPDDPASELAGTIRRRMIGILSAVRGDKALLEAQIKADGAVFDSLQKALREDLPAGSRHALELAANAVRAAVAQMEGLRI